MVNKFSRTKFLFLIVSLFVLSTISIVAFGAQNDSISRSEIDWNAAAADIGYNAAASTVAPRQAFVTTLVVTNTLDLESDSNTQTCGYDVGVFAAPPDGICTFRRAIRDAAARPPEDRPILIAFDIPTTDPNYNAQLNTFTIQIEDPLPPLETASVLDMTGNVSIDGSTQPIGRSGGPAIIINTNEYSLEIESTGNLINDLAFKGGGIINVKEDGNTIQNIWMGLADDGQSIHFRDPNDRVRMAGGGIRLASNNNKVTSSVISGAFARAIDIDGGDNNLINNNNIGTLAGGVVPAVPEQSQCVRSLFYDPTNHYGGWGISLSGSNNTISNNRIAGLHILQTENSTPPMALEIFGDGHTITRNFIGQDSGNNPVGVCGQGIKVSGSNTEIIENFIVRSRKGFEGPEDAAILASDSSPTFGGIRVQRNMVMDGPEKIYEFGPGIPSLLRLFPAPQLTSYDEYDIAGWSNCPGCTIDIYLDDLDELEETTLYIGSTTADNNGDFAYTMPFLLASEEAIRTQSTTNSFNAIGNYPSGTSTQFSQLFKPLETLNVAASTEFALGGEVITFTLEAGLVGATTPVTFTVNATDLSEPLLFVAETTSAEAYISWTTEGIKTISVEANNGFSTVTDSVEVEVIVLPQPPTATPSSTPGSGPSPTPEPSGTPGATSTPEPTSTPGPSPTPGPTETPDPSAGDRFIFLPFINR